MKNNNEDRWLIRYKLKMRKNPTPEEYLFKNALKSNNIKFRHQSLCYSKEFQCIVDFLIRTDGQSIVIEIDGDYHLSPLQKEKDDYRTVWLKENRGYDVIRFSNNEVNSDISGCLRKLAVYYINKVKGSQSKNFKSFCSILGLPESAGNIIKLIPKNNNYVIKSVY